MNRVLWNILFFIVLSITVVFFAVGIYEYIAGPTAVARLLKRMHIPFGYTFFLIVGLICFLVAQLLYLFRNRL